MRDRWIADLRARGVHQRWILFAGLAGMFAGMFTFTVLAERYTSHWCGFDSVGIVIRNRVHPSVELESIFPS